MSRQFNPTGRYESHIEEMRQNSVVARIVHDELERFWERVNLAFNQLREEELDPDTQQDIAVAKQDIKAAIAARFGRPGAHLAATFTRRLSGWNLFDMEHRKTIQEEFELAGLRTSPFYNADLANDFEAVVKELSRRWQTANQEEYRERAKRKCETLDVNGMRQEPQVAANRRRKTLWNNMKNSVVLLVFA
jgi:hypothetical protein